MLGRTYRLIPAAVLIALVLAAAAYVLPQGSRTPLCETSIWGVVVLAAFIGWGSLLRVVIAPKERVDLGLRAVWGASVTCAIGGALMAASLMKRTAAMLIVELGLLLAVATIAREREALFQQLRVLVRGVRIRPLFGCACAVLALLVSVHYLAGIADWHVNPYDDEIAYLSFVRKLLDTGSIVEPFSLRRLAALGGQTFFMELVSLRAEPSQGLTFDRSVSLLMAVLLVAGYRSEGRRPNLWFLFAGLVMFVTLPVIGINTASYMSGLAFFLGLHRTLTWAGETDRTVWKNALALSLVSAAICTLRQNYLVVPVGVLGFSYVARWLRVRGSLREPILVAVFTLAALVGWFIVGWSSNRTFLYPVVVGTANRALLLQSSVTTFWDEAKLFIWTAMEGLPFKTFFLFLFALVLYRERDPRRPVLSLAFGSLVGLVMLVHGTSQSDGDTLARYSFAFLFASVMAVVLAAATERSLVSSRPWLVRAFPALTIFALLLTLADSRTRLYPSYVLSLRNIAALARSTPRSLATRPPEASLYEQMQASVPAGKTMAVMLDEPYFLDFGRNWIFNLDMPGYASLPPGLPYFQGSRKVEEYFRSLGIRYIAFVRPDCSRYHYRREYWLERLTDEQEIWRAHAPYVLDFIDNLAELDTRHKRLFEARGLVVTDLEEAP